MRYLLAIAILLLSCRAVHAQHLERIQAEWAARLQAQENKKAVDAMKRRVKRQFNEQAKQVMPLDPISLKQWKRKIINRREYWVFEIKKQNVTTNQVHYNPDLGYVVDRNFRKVTIQITDKDSESVDFGWLTLDEAIVDKFGDSDEALAKLPEIPGWGRYYDLSSDDQIAEMKRRAAIAAREKAITAAGEKAGTYIGEALAPGLSDKVLDKLADPPKRGDPLKLKRTSDDDEKIVFITENGKYFVYQYKDDSGFEVLERKKDGSLGKRYPELHSTFKELRDFLTIKEKESNALGK